MDHEEKIKIIIAAITAETSVSVDDNLKRGIANGLIRVKVLEKAEQDALDTCPPCMYLSLTENKVVYKDVREA